MTSKLHKRSDGSLRWYLIDPVTEEVVIDTDFDTPVLHREDGPAAEGPGQYKAWVVNNKFHRVGGPAVIYEDGSFSYYENDELHRIDGPAIKFADGSESWYLNGEKLTKEEWQVKSAKYRTLIGKLAQK